MSQQEIKDFLKKEECRKYTSTEIFFHLYKNKKDGISKKALWNCLNSLCKHNEISYDSCIIRKMSGFEVVGRVFWMDSSGMQITPLVHCEEIEEEKDLKDLFIKGFKKVK